MSFYCEIERKCKNCGKPFFPSKGNVKYCCRACADEAYKKQKIERAKNPGNQPTPCRFCKKTFLPRCKNTTVCYKPECRDKLEDEQHQRKLARSREYAKLISLNRPPKPKRPCAICGKLFTQQQWKVKVCQNQNCIDAQKEITRKIRLEASKKYRLKNTKKYKCPRCGKKQSTREDYYCKDCIEKVDTVYAYQDTAWDGYSPSQVSLSVRTPQILYNG